MLSRKLTVNKCFGLDDDTDEITLLGTVRTSFLPALPFRDSQIRIQLIFKATQYANPGYGSGLLTFTRGLLGKTDWGRMCNEMSGVITYSWIPPIRTTLVEKVLVVMKDGKRKAGSAQYISTETIRDDKQVEEKGEEGGENQLWNRGAPPNESPPNSIQI